MEFDLTKYRSKHTRSEYYKFQSMKEAIEKMSSFFGDFDTDEINSITLIPDKEGHCLMTIVSDVTFKEWD